MNIPIVLSVEDTYTKMSNNHCEIIIRADGKIVINGSIKDAALCLFNFILENEYVDGLVSLELNRSIRIDFDKNFELTSLTEEKPPFFDELAAEFRRIAKMKMFW